MTMVRTQVQIEAEQHRRLKAEAYRRSMSMSAVVRELLAEKLADAQERRRTEAESAWEAFIGCGNDTAADVSVNHDKYLAEILHESHR